MHPECPDYDLCENCEAFPIAVHPSNHPMLKMKTSDTVIPTVYRVGQTSVIEPTAVDNKRETLTDRSRSQSTPSSTAPNILPASPAPVHVIPVPPSHARSTSPAEDNMMRSSTPVARSFFDHVVFEKGEVRPNQSQVKQSPRSPSPTRPPKLPPKPEMISHQPWASIPDFFNPVPHFQYAPSTAFLPSPGQNNVGDSQTYSGTIQHPVQPPIPPVPAPLLQHVPKSVPAPQVAPESTFLPTVPNHTPNPWPTTNPVERQELLELITELSGSSGPAPTRSPVLTSPVSLNNTFEQPLSQKPARNNPFLTPPSTIAELPRAITPLVERPTAVVFQESRPSANDPLPTWASLTPDVSHLVQENLERPTEAKPASVVSQPASVIGSPFSGQALLNRPTLFGSATSSFSSYPRSLAELIDQIPALIPPKIPNLGKLPEVHAALSAKFVEDITVFDGQAFPPGAEFVKCWRLLNTSERELPENTELVFVAGDPLADFASPPVLIGKVAAGVEFDVWTGELKVCLTLWFLKMILIIIYHLCRHLILLDDMLGIGG